MTEKDLSGKAGDVKVRGKFSIVDLLMVIMIVGVILTIIMPLRQVRQHETIVRTSLKEIEKIIRANEDFKVNSGWDEYAMDLSQLNVRDLDTSVFKFAVNDTSVVATTEALGVGVKSYWYDLRDKRFKVPEDSRDLIVPAWLP